MSANVDGESRALDEALSTAGDGAGVRALIGVNSVVSLKIRLAVEALVARVPVALKGTSGGLVVDKLKEFHCEGWER